MFLSTIIESRGKVCGEKYVAKVKSLSRILLFATPWTVTYQAPPSMGFSRQEYWRGLPFPSLGDLPEPRSPTLQADASPSEPPRKSKYMGTLPINASYQVVLEVKTPRANAGDRHGFNPWVRKISWRRTQQHTPIFLPGESRGQKSLAGYSS